MGRDTGSIDVLLLSRYGRLGASSRVRSYQYLPLLAEHGVRVTVAPLLADDYVRDLYEKGHGKAIPVAAAYFRRLVSLAASRTFDVVWIEKEAMPWLPGWYEAVLARLGTPFVVDYDDAVFHRYDHRPATLVPGLRHKIARVMRRATIVVVANRYLADYAHRAGARRIVELPTVVDVSRYQSTQKTANGSLRVGWIGNPLTAEYLDIVRPALTELARRHRLTFVVVGASLDIDGVPVESRRWSEETEIDDIQTFDLGIMPLPDTPWCRGKSGYKLIQYLACGRPAVASPVGANRDIIEDGRDGLLASTTTEWVRAIDELAGAPERRREMGRTGRLKVEQRFSLSTAAPILAAVLKEAAASGRHR
jgi:glycosyltransferase involved in cell wall biosynthesis